VLVMPVVPCTGPIDPRKRDSKAFRFKPHCTGHWVNGPGIGRPAMLRDSPPVCDPCANRTNSSPHSATKGRFDPIGPLNDRAFARRTE
jgi:hypothetical protein